METIPFDPNPNDVVSFDYHNQSLKCVDVARDRDSAYNKLLRKFWPHLKRTHATPSSEDYDRMASDIVNTIVNVRKGRFLRLVDAGPDKKGRCIVMSPKASHEKVRTALFRIHQRFLAAKGSDNHKAKSKRSSFRTQGGRRERKRYKTMGETTIKCEDEEIITIGDTNTTTSSDGSVDLDQDTDCCSDDEESENEVTLPSKANNIPSQETIIPFKPKKKDVVATKKQSWLRRHPGNIAYRNLLDQLYPQFLQQGEEQVSNSNRSAVAEKVVKWIFQQNGRFLKWTCQKVPDPKFCLVMSEEACVQKVQKAFHLMRSKKGVTPGNQVDAHQPFACAIPHPKPTSHGSLSVQSKHHHPKRNSSYADKPFSKIKQDEVDRNTERRSFASRASLDHSDGNTTWTYERLYAATATPPKEEALCGSPEDEVAMRKWLNDHKLPQSVADLLLTFGARSVDDIVLMVDSNVDDLKKLASLDLIKLTKAVQSKQSEPDEVEFYV